MTVAPVGVIRATFAERHCKVVRSGILETVWFLAVRVTDLVYFLSFKIPSAERSRPKLVMKRIATSAREFPNPSALSIQ